MVDPRFILGFATLASMIPEIVGQPKENEYHNPTNGDGLQATTNGLMVWRKADNWTAFTDGYRTWINGPNGLQDRLNTERFDWEKVPVAYVPHLLTVPSTNLVYPFLTTPHGFLLHGTRSGVQQSIAQEFASTVAYVRWGSAGLGWNYTVGQGIVARHINPGRWGWNARTASMYYVALEFAQPDASYPVDDEMVKAACWCVNDALETWPRMPVRFVSHAEVEAWGETGRADGKSDVFPFRDARMEDLRTRIVRRLG